MLSVGSNLRKQYESRPTFTDSFQIIIYCTSIQYKIISDADDNAIIQRCFFYFTKKCYFFFRQIDVLDSTLFISALHISTRYWLQRLFKILDLTLCHKMQQCLMAPQLTRVSSHEMQLTFEIARG